jgi:hypothetical protein
MLRQTGKHSAVCRIVAYFAVAGAALDEPQHWREVCDEESVGASAYNN